MRPFIEPKRKGATSSSATGIRGLPVSNRIKILPSLVVNQIRAGEVVESPTSLLKEVVENSLDAKASRIDIEIRNNGLELLRIDDDGHGMAYEEIPLAFMRHATSKIKTFQDIYALSSYGFRGEALTSLACVAQVHCLSSPGPLASGGRYVIRGGEALEHSPHASTEQGTSLFVKNLFYNTPVRLKFVRSKMAEKNSLMRTITSFLITNPSVAFSIKWDDGDKSFYPSLSLEETTARVEQIFYPKGKGESVLYQTSGEYEGYAITLFASSRAFKSQAPRVQFLFVNNRLIEDRILHSMIAYSLPSLWPENKIGHYCALIEAPPKDVDVNIHPRKTSVKFLNAPAVYALLKSVVHNIETSAKKGSPDDAPTPPRPYGPFPKGGFPRGKLNPALNPHNQYLSVHPELSLVFVDKCYHLVNNSLFLREIIQKFIENPSTESTPLLVCEPMDYGPNSKERIDYLNSLGFELEFLGENRLILKSFPTALADIPFIQLVRSFFSTLSQPEKNSPKALLLQSVEGLSLEAVEAHRYLDSWPWSRDCQAVRAVDHSLVEELFHGG